MYFALRTAAGVFFGMILFLFSGLSHDVLRRCMLKAKNVVVALLCPALRPFPSRVYFACR